MMKKYLFNNSLYEAVNINKDYLIKLAGGPDRFKEVKAKVDKIIQESMIQANEATLNKIKAVLMNMEIKESLPLNVVEIVHDLYVANKTNELLKLNSDSTVEHLQEIFRKHNASISLGYNLNDTERCIWLRPKLFHDFGDGFKWVQSVDENGNPQGFITSELTNKLMKHCGNHPTVKEGDVYYGLRDYGNKEYLSVILDRNNRIKESKGYGNQRPTNGAELSKYVKWLMLHNDVTGTSYQSGHAPSSNYKLSDLTREDRNEVVSKKPEMVNDLDRVVIEYSEKLESGEITKNDVIADNSQGRISFTELYAILGNQLTPEDVNNCITSGKVSSAELARNGVNLLTTEAQRLYIDKNDDDIIKIMMALYIDKQEKSGMDIPYLISKHPECVNEIITYPNQTTLTTKEFIKKFINEYLQSISAGTDFSKINTSVIDDEIIELLDFKNNFRNNGSLFRIIPKPMMNTLLSSTTFTDAVLKDPSLIKNIPGDIGNAFLDSEAFRRLYAKGDFKWVADLAYPISAEFIKKYYKDYLTYIEKVLREGSTNSDYMNIWYRTLQYAFESKPGAKNIEMFNNLSDYMVDIFYHFLKYVVPKDVLHNRINENPANFISRDSSVDWLDDMSNKKEILDKYAHVFIKNIIIPSSSGWKGIKLMNAIVSEGLLLKYLNSYKNVFSKLIQYKHKWYQNIPSEYTSSIYNIFKADFDDELSQGNIELSELPDNIYKHASSYTRSIIRNKILENNTSHNMVDSRVIYDIIVNIIEIDGVKYEKLLKNVKLYIFDEMLRSEFTFSPMIWSYINVFNRDIQTDPVSKQSLTRNTMYMIQDNMKYTNAINYLISNQDSIHELITYEKEHKKSHENLNNEDDEDYEDYSIFDYMFGFDTVDDYINYLESYGSQDKPHKLSGKSAKNIENFMECRMLYKGYVYEAVDK